MKKTLFVLALAIFTLFSTEPVQAEGVASIFGNLYIPMFGKQSASIAPKSFSDCSTMQSGSGWLSQADVIFCYMKYGASITGLGKVTQAFSIGGSTSTFHVEITSGCTAPNVTGSTTNYNFQINQWGCIGGASTCTTPSQFTRVVSVCYNYTDDGTGLNGTVNQGDLLMDTSIFDGSPSGSGVLYMTYDLGTSSTAQKAIVKTLHTVVDSATPGPFSVRADISRSDKNHIAWGMSFWASSAFVSSSNSNGINSFRFTGTIDRTANTGTAYVEMSGLSGSGETSTANLTASGDAPTGGACLSRTADGSSGDWDYTVTGTAPSNSACIPATVNAADSINTIEAYTVSGIAGTWHGMAANPSSL
jgi:hypothetical protein